MVCLLELLILERFFPDAARFKEVKTIRARIDEYRCRDLSFDKDALDAIAGVFSLYTNAKEPVRLLCGLPLFDKPELTFTVVEALSWRLASPYTVRRPEFPSWSCVGWKTSKKLAQPGRPKKTFVTEVSNSSNPGGDTDIIIRAELPDGKVLDWASYHDEILNMTASGNILRILRISGWVFPARGHDENWLRAKVRPSEMFNYDFMFLRLSENANVVNRDLLVVVTFMERRPRSLEFLIFAKTGYGDVYERLGWDAQTYYLYDPDQSGKHFGHHLPGSGES